MRVLVTGGSGFIGSNLVDALLHHHEVASIDISPPQIEGHRSVWRQTDILQASELSAVIGEFRPQTVYHLAARTDLRGTEVNDYKTNTAGVSNLIHALSILPVKPTTVYASSRLVFSIEHHPKHNFDYMPSTAYGASKIAGERIVLDRGDTGGRWCIVRPTSIWGPWFSTPYRDFFDAIAKGRFVNINGYDPRKSFGYVGNAVHQLQVIAKALSGTRHRSVFWLTDYPPLFVAEWAKLIASELQVRPPRTVALWPLRMAALIGDASQRISGRDAPLTSFRLRNLLTDMIYDTEDLSSVVGTLPFTVEEGVRSTCSWLRDQ